MRIIRALEIFEITGKPISQWQKKNENIPWVAVNIGLTRERDELYRRINERVEMMFANGLIDEVIKLHKYNYHNSIGYRKTIGYLETSFYLYGLSTLDETKKIIAQKTRNYAKRQLTWFKKEKNIKWFNLTGFTDEKIFPEIFRFIAGELEKNKNINEKME